MFKIILSLYVSFFLLLGYEAYENLSGGSVEVSKQVTADSLRNATSWPAEISVTHFAGSDLTPSPACLAVHANGAVFVGVDKIGSLGKTPGKGSIIKLIDSNNDGKVDSHTEFAMVDNPRGIIAIGDQVFVLYTTFSAETKLATGMELAVFKDKDRDGKADGPPTPLIQNISSPKFLQSRGTDHATNGIRMGIDGWIYIAVGDFGFHNAVDRSGTKLTMLGGGVVRVRPDGTEMEVYTHGLRNIYDVAIDPFMNIFTRDNTNDGGGWNIRFSHHIQTGEYGYPLLFKNFTEEILPALADLGGGSGTGALFMDDANWPEKYNKVPMMADWGTSMLSIHRVTADGASFLQKNEGFIKLAQITDLDIDGSGRLYLSAWDGAGYSGSPDKGFIVRAVPKDWKYKAFPDLNKATLRELAMLLKSPGAVARLNAQQEMLSRPSKNVSKTAWNIAADKSLPLEVRVAGIFTYAQAAAEKSTKNLLQLTEDESVREFALRALTDRKGYVKDLPAAPFLKALNDKSARVQATAIVSLGRLGRREVIDALLGVSVPPSFRSPLANTEGPHATPNSSLINAHLAVRSLLSLNATEEAVKAIGSKNSALALWTLRYIHKPKAVEGLIAAYSKVSDPGLKKEILSTLSRLYKKEAPYQGEYWWSTRPDGHGPFYNTVEWESSPLIRQILVKEWNNASDSEKMFYTRLNDKHQMGISEFGSQETVASIEERVDLEAIKMKKGQIGNSSIEDVMLAIAEIKGNADLGKAVFLRQGCQACHSTSKSEPLKGPFMGQIGSIMNAEQIAESILKPNASISQGFATVLITTKAQRSFMGFVTAESAQSITLRDIGGGVRTLKTADIVSRKEMENSMMPEGLANSLSFEEFASLVNYLSQQK
ncbi:MAG: HEAT repeat domain-containing protein [Bacteroidota bacterium]